MFVNLSSGDSVLTEMVQKEIPKNLKANLKTNVKQECIPVGCLPSATVAVCFRGGLHTPLGPGTPLEQASPPEQAPSPWEQTLPAARHAGISSAMHAGIAHPPAVRHAGIPYAMHAGIALPCEQSD